MPRENPQCGKCGYDLSGLSFSGTCPECGEPFNTRTGKGLRNELDAFYRADALVARIRTIILGLIAVCILVCAGVLQLASTASVRPVVVGMIFFLLMAMATLTSYLYETRPD